MIEFSSFSVYADNDSGRKAAVILCDELKKRTGRDFSLSDGECKKIIFAENKELPRDSYKIEMTDSEIVFFASGVRGFVYAVGMFLRKTVYVGDKIFITENISGSYSPYMQIRGHQLGWRTTSNTYEAWTEEEYFSYIKDLMFFGCNTFEHTVFPDVPENRNSLMKYSEREFINRCNEKAKSLDIDISYWYPNDEEPTEKSAELRRDFFDDISHADIYFPPGGDPGEFAADVFVERTKAIAKKIREVKPNIKVYPSAQAPHEIENWGDVFIAEMNKLPEEIDGVITGPNAAADLHTLRSRLPIKYPIRFYPDITHNLRCEYPVHFCRNDWHYAFASTLGRESVNPRPTEYQKLHRMTRNYIIGSVSYSEGINDDVNKFVWSNLDFFPDAEISETLADYARLFFPRADTEKVVCGILGLEKNWEGDPAENPHIEATFGFFDAVRKENPELIDNFRFLLCLFRAECDLFVKKKRIFEKKLIRQSEYYLREFDFDSAEKILNSDLSEKCKKLRNDIENIGKMLFEKTGYQLDTKRYFANGWERGATLDTIDNPVSDRPWLLNRINYGKKLSEDKQKDFTVRLLERNKTNRGEYYFSFAENSLAELNAEQEKGFYMDFQGDRPNVNNGSIPMSMLQVYDHYSLRFKTGGLADGEKYKLMLNIKPRYKDCVTDFTIKINGNILYKGVQYGGKRNEMFESEMSAPGFELHEYSIPENFIQNGCVEVEISEPKVGIMLSEIFIKPQ